MPATNLQRGSAQPVQYIVIIIIFFIYQLAHQPSSGKLQIIIK